MKNFILIRTTSDELISLNPLHIIYVKTTSDEGTTKIMCRAAMAETFYVYDSVENITKQINESLKN